MTTSQLLVSTDQAGVELPADAPRYSLLVANGNEEVVAAQRLRHQVFAEEMGATLNSPEPGLDVDYFDEFCDHLVVRDDNTGEIVGTYRMLPPDRAARAGKLYSDSEFDLTALDALRPSLVETGRSCVHPDHRSGAVVSLVWAGIGRYMLLAGHRYLAGCASVPLTDGGVYAAGVWDVLRAKHYADESLRVTPLNPWRVEGVERPARAILPPLIKGYTRLGAKIYGPPALDADFGVADFFVLLDLHNVDERYLKFFLGVQG
ncbi:GNAT family N-acetyltransferase [Amycolatopsis sp. EV170708-02-1]|uniref:GNAT family N-acetyltransferase n=1 Tax=Amycolatopsis sp. EV170708-02-1 TaxID=2919322 RepID=UPI001F0BAF12|nr:GNAT family N-acyltransferase [Amycolatopsis sp. EV170708-02-1]UMP06618.1 GNAT family N-acetyltransferase [Amycolatopsis sp. EV170708-02-1]